MPSFWGEETVEQRMAVTGSRASGFDYLRIGLSVLVLVFHSLQIQHTPFTDFMVNGPGRIIRNISVPMFFGLGGFLVAASLDRTKSFITFLGLRTLRIFPALWADILFSALILGPLVTTLPLADYFTSPTFRGYFWNLLGDIHYYLPGVFAGNFPGAEVNGQLWTVPWDLGGYMLLSVLTFLGFNRRRGLFVASVLFLQVFFCLFFYLKGYIPGHHRQGEDLAWTVIPCFLVGAAFHFYKERIIFSPKIFYVSCAIIAIALLIHRSLIFLLPVPILYVTVFIGLQNPKRIWLVSSGDYSYGVYLYHRQFQQALWLFVPLARLWYVNAVLSLSVSFVAAYLSWHLLEKHALAQKSRLNARDQWFFERFPLLAVQKGYSDEFFPKALDPLANEQS